MDLIDDGSWEALFESTRNLPVPEEAPPRVLTREELLNKVIISIQMMEGDVIWLPDNDFLGTLEDLLRRKCGISSDRVKNIMELQVTPDIVFLPFNRILLKHFKLSPDEITDFLNGARYICLYERLRNETEKSIIDLLNRAILFGLNPEPGTGKVLDRVEQWLDCDFGSIK